MKRFRLNIELFIVNQTITSSDNKTPNLCTIVMQSSLFQNTYTHVLGLLLILSHVNQSRFTTLHLF